LNDNSSSTPTATSSTHSSLNFSDTNRPLSGTSNSSSFLSRLNPFNFFSRNSADSGKNDSLKDDDSKDNSKIHSIIGNSSGNLISVHNSDGITFFAPDDIPDYLNGGDVYSYEDFSCGEDSFSIDVYPCNSDDDVDSNRLEGKNTKLFSVNGRVYHHNKLKILNNGIKEKIKLMSTL